MQIMLVFAQGSCFILSVVVLVLYLNMAKCFFTVYCWYLSHHQILLCSGQQYDKNGNRVNWWTKNSTAEFKKRTQCFVDQYSNYTQQGVPVILLLVACWYDTRFVIIQS